MSKRIKTLVYDNSGNTVDRYTVYIPNGYSGWDVYYMSQNACSPNGVNLYSDTVLAFTAPGKAVRIRDLPKEVQTAIKRRKVEK